ncbi:hypothetical protein IE81DRAFT_84744 [Ceraceosorus guamensis]|uniref:Uncharacterized protein n=1 Tax=Ceraceosorus guamensis TaxID=1522189 RepID=A0A316W8B5_9BASI|nr:hypothetical protein IE81DRAFT_84744 [Ceraceosorus guamensis]PWN46150.1 hypothetical protein IE81DRAFT_84744 [Ceraceosorus guamensis]
MAPIPPALVRLLTGLAAEQITRRLAASPAFQSFVHRVLHEADHLPHRLQGREVPPWRDPHVGRHNGPGMMGKFEDPGEPHDEPSPFSSSGKPSDARAHASSSSAESSEGARNNTVHRVPRDKVWADRLEKQAMEEDKRLEDAQTKEREFQELMDRLRNGPGKR